MVTRNTRLKQDKTTTEIINTPQYTTNDINILL